MAAFSFFRSALVDAPPARVHDLIDDLHNWRLWSPWEGLDDDLQRTYSGPDRGAGATYAWSGNRKAGVGQMKISDSTTERIDIELRFEKPFKTTNDVRFDLTPAQDGAATEVRWTMSGNNTGLWAVLAKVIPTEKMVGKDFDKGLANLQRVAPNDETSA